MRKLTRGKSKKKDDRKFNCFHRHRILNFFSKRVDDVSIDDERNELVQEFAVLLTDLQKLGTFLLIFLDFVPPRCREFASLRSFFPPFS